MKIASPVPLIYLGLMCVAGAIFAFAVRGKPELQAGITSPLVWLIGVALAYEVSQKLLPRLNLQPILPLQRFAGYFAGAVLYLVLTRILN